MNAPFLHVYVSKPDTTRQEQVYAQIGGVKVGAAGELIVVSSTDSGSRNPDDFVIFAPGHWTQVSATRVDD